MSTMAISRIMAADPTNTGTTNGTNTNGTNTTGSTTSGSGAAKTAGNSELGREAFLQLLVAQLKYQDPSKPMDASEMIAQSAQLTMVDKLSEISTAMTAQSVTDRLTLAGSVLGKQITFTGTDGYKVQAVVNSVKFANGELVLSTPDWDVPMSSVESIGTVPTAAASAAATSTPTTASTTTPTSAAAAAAAAAAALAAFASI